VYLPRFKVISFGESQCHHNRMLVLDREGFQHVNIVFCLSRYPCVVMGAEGGTLSRGGSQKGAHGMGERAVISLQGTDVEGSCILSQRATTPSREFLFFHYCYTHVNYSLYILKMLLYYSYFFLCRLKINHVTGLQNLCLFLDPIVLMRTILFKLNYF
jgi:hypothetical protein